MATKNTTGTMGAEAAALPAVTTDRLRDTIKDMDAISQDGFSRIEALARITLLALETPDACRFIELIAQTLDTIATVAQTSMDAVNSGAEEVGCNWVMRAEQRRIEARRVAIEREAQGAGSTR